jgi:hypothetical protein
MKLYYSMGGDQLSYVENEKALSLAFLTQGIGEDEFRERFRQLVSDAVDEFRDYLTDLPKEPRLLVSPLQHYPEMVSLNSK